MRNVRLVDQIRQSESAVGKIRFEPTDDELNNLVFRKSIFAVESIEKGDRFTEENIRVIRPGSGLAPQHLDTVLGRSASKPIERGTPLSWDAVCND